MIFEQANQFHTNYVEIVRKQTPNAISASCNLLVSDDCINDLQNNKFLEGEKILNSPDLKTTPWQ